MFRLGCAKTILLGILFFCLFAFSAFAAAPTVVSISPASGSTTPNTARNFTCVYSDADGWENLKAAYLLVNTSPRNLANAVYLYYDQNNNKLYLRDDANTAWLGGYAPGAANKIENSQVKLNCGAVTVSGTANNLTVKFNITFKPAYSGKNYNTYLKAADDTAGATGWVKKGVYAVTYPPQLGAVSPASGACQINIPQVFSAVYSDQDGWENLQYLYFLINTSTSGANCLYGYYNQNTNKLYLRNDANTAWLGGYAPGSANIIENSYVKLDCAQTTASGSGSALTLNWQVSFKSAFIGDKNIYLSARDDANSVKDWALKGTCDIYGDVTPPVISISPVNSPTNQNVTLVYSVSDDFTPSEQITVSGDNSPYLNDGEYQVTLTATDLAGNSATASLSFTIDKTAPLIIITSPANGAVLEDSQIQLQGTVDGAAFSETRALNSGENTLTKSVTDAAGNSTSASVTVYLYLGESIGPEGGEVSSYDGRVKLVVSAGALSASAQIKLITLDNVNIQSSSPPNTNLLSVVECKPYGLSFNQPVSLIYNLAYPEIPGTPAELAYYDIIQNTVIPTGQICAVPADGYTLNFWIMHFSAYAALRNFTTQGAPIGAGVKIPLPDMFTGAFSHSIPIAVSPGRKGMQPAFALSYRSGNANSWLGLGFGLNPGYIVRSTRLGPPSYNDTQDTFYFISDAGSTELVYLTDNLYQAKIESSFAKFFKESNDSWRVVNKDGTVLRFGEEPDAKESSASGTFAWYLTKAQDTNSNYIAYDYIKDQGKSYLSRIDYTGNEAMAFSPTNSVEFFLEGRDDVTSNYISSARIVTAKRLKEIQAKVNSALVWRYVLEYAYSEDTNRSLLASVTQSGADGKALPKQIFTYQKSK